MPYTQQDINSWYQAVQFRDGVPATVGSYASLLNAGLLTQDQIWQAILNEQYTTNYVNPVIRLYQAALGRAPDQSGQNFWVDDFAAGKITSLDVARSFASSSEFKDAFGNSSADEPINAVILTKLYQNVLQREPDSAGYAFWLNSGLNVAQVLNFFANSPEFTTSTDTAVDFYQRSQLNHTLPTKSVSLWSFNPPPQPAPEPPAEPESDPGSAPDPTTFTVTNSSGSLSFGGTATGDVTFTVASDGTATFTRGGVTASSTYAVSTIAAAPETIKLSADVSTISLANAYDMVNILNYNANGHTYTLSDASGPLGSMTVARADVVEGATNAASYTYTVLDSILHADNLNFTTAYASNRGVILSEGGGNQTVTGSSYADSIDGGSGNDSINGGAGADFLDGGTGANYFVYSTNAEFVTAGTVVDSITGGADTDTIQINAAITVTTSDSLATRLVSVEQLIAESQSPDSRTHSIVLDASAKLGSITTIDLSGDTNASSTGLITMVGVSTGLTLIGVNGGINSISGGAGDDSIRGGVCDDLLIGGAGSDIIEGGAGTYLGDSIWVNGSGAIDSAIDTVVFNAVVGLSSDSNLAVNDTLEDIAFNDFIQINATNVHNFSVNTNVRTDTAYYLADLDGNGSAGGGGDINAVVNGSMFSSFDTINAYDPARDANARAQTIVNLTGTSGADSIVGGQNNDTITGGAGQDTLYGGDGDDVFIISSGADHGNTNAGEWIYGDGGVDVIRFTSTTVNDSLNLSYFIDVEEVRIVAADGSINATEGLSVNVNWLGMFQGIAVYGNAGSNTLVGNQDGYNTIEGGGGNDSIEGGDLTDSLVGGIGLDTIIGHGGADILSGGAGDNYYVYTTNAEFISSGAVVDSISGGADTDTVQINDAITLTTSDSLATRLVSVEQLVAESQSADSRTHSIVLDTSAKLGTITTIDLSGDTNASSTGVITMIGVNTSLTLMGVNGGGSNTISGGAFNDSITGGVGADTLRGGYGIDTIFGGDGNDSIVGNGGADSLAGGGGNDVFTYSNVADWSSSEVITDFATSALNRVSIDNGALSAIDGDILLFDLSNLEAITGYVALGTTVTSGVSTLVAGDWAIGTADQAHAQFVLIGSDTLAFDPDGTGATAAITVVGHYTCTGLTGTMIALTA